MPRVVIRTNTVRAEHHFGAEQDRNKQKQNNWKATSSIYTIYNIYTIEAIPKRDNFDVEKLRHALIKMAAKLYQIRKTDFRTYEFAESLPIGRTIGIQP